MNNIIKYTSKETSLNFIKDLLNTICKSVKDIDLSIIVDGCLAEFITKHFEYNENVLKVRNDFEDDFGELTGFALVTILKSGSSVQVISEDYSYLNSENTLTYKNHEADILLLLEGKYHVKFDDLIKLYEPNKTILVSFEDETNKIEELLFS